MIVLGVIRIRAAHRRHQEDSADAEMAWDDSPSTSPSTPWSRTEPAAALRGRPARTLMTRRTAVTTSPLTGRRSAPRPRWESAASSS